MLAAGISGVTRQRKVRTTRADPKFQGNSVGADPRRMAVPYNHTQPAPVEY